MTWFSYLFEARSIQAFLFASNRLKEVIGASELVEQLTSPQGMLDDCLAVVEGEIQFSRRGGGAFSAFSRDPRSMDRLATLWPLLVRQCVPDLVFHDARGAGESAHSAFLDAYPRLVASPQGSVARLPSGGPLSARCRRTGEPAAVVRRSKPDDSPQPIDAATARKLHPRFSRGEALVRRFAPNEPAEAWPLNLSPSEGEPGERDFPFLDDRREIGLIHVDGNGLGAALATLQAAVGDRPDEYVDVFAAFSAAVSDAAQSAARTATETVLGPAQVERTYPARPVVLGGDDLTMLVRADLALTFACEYARSFASASEARLREVGKRFRVRDLPKRLTACAGIAYATANQPFHSLHKLADDLCRHAKTTSRAARKAGSTEIPPSVSFFRVTTSLVDEYPSALESQLTSQFGGVRYRQTLETYALEPSSAIPRLDDLVSLLHLLDDPVLGRGGPRELLGLMGLAPAAARRQYSRWRENLGKSAASRTVLSEFDRLLGVLAHAAGNDVPFGPFGAELQRSPLGDVVALRAVGNTGGATLPKAVGRTR